MPYQIYKRSTSVLWLIVGRSKAADKGSKISVVTLPRSMLSAVIVLCKEGSFCQHPDVIPTLIYSLEISLDDLVPVHLRPTSLPSYLWRTPGSHILREKSVQAPLADGTGHCGLLRPISDYLAPESLFLMPKIIIMHLRSKASSFVYWLDFRCQVSQP